ncbi:MAG TPA: hypothetical protein DIS78_10665 [Lachnospiraceae bacterium]|nr:hypothetical protein [Lachnospiraceae bacterium]
MYRRVKIIPFLIVILILTSLGAAGCKHDKEDAEVTAEETIPLKAQPEEKIADPEPEPEPEPEPVYPLEKYDEILKINPYVSGWLTIDDTVIDDPVVYTPQDQNFFLHKAIDGTDESKGTLFIAVNWGDGLNQTLIYGHNMKDGTAFGSLLKFADESYGMSHHTIRFDTLYEEKEYELYGVFYSQIAVEDLETDEDRAQREQAVFDNAVAGIEDGETGKEIFEEELTLDDLGLYGEPVEEDIYRQEKDEDNGRFRYYYYTDLRNRDDFEYFAKNVKERALYDTGVEAEWGDEFVTLSTCSYQVKNGRFVVVGIRHKDSIY